MRSSLRFIVVALVLLAMAIPPGKAVTGQEKTQSLAPPPMVTWEPIDPNAWSQNGRAQVSGIIQRMQKSIDLLPPKGLLTGDTVRQVAAIYGPNGILTGYDGLTYRGAREIAMYFHQLMFSRHVEDLKIEIKFVYAKEFTDGSTRRHRPIARTPGSANVAQANRSAESIRPAQREVAGAGRIRAAKVRGAGRGGL
jgi:hypothetical protein